MNYAGLTFRNELKYECTTDMLHILEHRIQSITTADQHADDRDHSYTVRSLYFDDYRNSCCHDNDLGIDLRQKYRIRIYNGETKVIRLEKKLKYNTKSHKSVVLLSLDQYEMLVSGNVNPLLNSNEPLLREFAVKISCQKFEPKIIVQYERKAFTAFPGNVRITLDTNCAASYQTDRFLQHDLLLYPIQEKGFHVLEIKYDAFLPGYIKQALQMNTLRQTTFSKYYISRHAVERYWR